jgi:hypothetical protein
MMLETGTASSVTSRSARCWARAAPARPVAISVRVSVAHTGVLTVVDRVTDRIPGKRTRTVMVRAARPAARSRPATRSHRYPSVERSRSGVALCRPSAAWAPMDDAGRP